MFEAKTISFRKQTVGNVSRLLYPKRALAVPTSGQNGIDTKLFQFGKSAKFSGLL